MVTNRRHTARTAFLIAALLGVIGLVPDLGKGALAVRVISSFPRGFNDGVYVDAPGGLLYQIGTPDDTGIPGTVLVRDLATLKVRKTVLTTSEFAGDAGSHQPGNLAAVDTVRHRVFFPYSVSNQPYLTLAIIDGPGGKVINAFQLCSPSVAASAPCAPSAASGVEGIFYWPQDDILYLLYGTPGDPAKTSAGAPAQLHVQAVDVTSGSRLWNYPVPGCTSLLSPASAIPGTAEPLGRSGDSLYLACVSGMSSVGGTVGTGVVLKLAVHGKAMPDGVAAYAAPRIPTRGLFDPGTQRMFLFEESQAQVVSVFDGVHEVWVGDVSSDQPRNQMGVSPGTGRVYLCGVTNEVGIERTGGLLVTDAGVETPATVGATFPDINCSDDSTLSPIQADPASGRVFVPAVIKEEKVWSVVRDEVPAYRAPSAFDPDEGAEDIPEQAGVTETNLAAEGGAYGARLVWVGGPNNAVDNVTSAPYIGASLRDTPTGITFQNRNRDLRFADIPLARLADDGLSAGAISMGRDERFEADLGAIREYRGDERAALKEAGLDTTATPTWPFEPSVCFAFGGETDVSSDDHEGSETKCDLKANLVSADAVAKKPVAKNVQDLLTSLEDIIKVGEASAHVELRRDAALGLVAVTESVSRNVVIAGTVFIAEARAKATASAAGRPGKATTSYEPYFRGVRVVGSDGTTAYECEDVCVPRQVIDAINEALGPRIRARLPQPGGYLKGSPKGSTASIEQGFWDRTEEQVLFDKPPNDLTVPAFELQVNMDVFSHSGYIVQLAGVSAYTRYAISRLPELFPPGGPITTIITGPPPIGPIGPSEITPPRVVTRTLVDKVRHGVRWVFKWQRDALRLLATWALLLTPLYVAVRRRFMLTGTPKAG